MTSRPANVVNGEHRARPPPSSHYYSPSSFSSSPSFKGCCCCLFLLFSFLALLVLAIVLVIVLAVKPKKPQFDLQQVGVQYVGITANSAEAAAASSETASLSLNIRLLFTAENPNKVGIKYGESKFTVMYRGIPLGEGTVAGFYQAAHSVREVETVVAVDRVNLQQADASDLVKDVSLNDRVELRVLGDVGAKIRIVSFDTPAVQDSYSVNEADLNHPEESESVRNWIQVAIDCAIVISPMKQSLTYKQCGFNGVNV